SMLDNVQLYHSEVSYKQPLLMFRNQGKGMFKKVSENLGPDFIHPIVGRGLATVDFDNDGDTDIVTNNRGDYPELLRNDGGNANHWLEILLIGTKSNRDAVGARVKVVAGDLKLFDQRKGGMSYQSSQDPRLHFGLNQQERVDAIEIRWPSGEVTKLENVKSDQIIAVREGAGVVPQEFPRIRWR